LEITENVCLHSSEAAIAVFQELNNLGIQFDIDDFGTGYSSLSYLQYFPIQTIKIDRSFIHRMDTNANNIDIIRTIIALAHDMGMDAIAEGIETQDQLDDLKKLGCNYGQGYLLSHPMDKDKVESYLGSWLKEIKTPPAQKYSIKLDYAD
jgi:EAL domain-containing protein (putative c-di-GMP-specific phosphodiesterase class I)